MRACLNHLEHGAAPPSAEVVGHAANVRVSLELVKGGHVALGQVHDVDVVSHTGAVPGGVIGAKD